MQPGNDSYNLWLKQVRLTIVRLEQSKQKTTTTKIKDNKTKQQPKKTTKNDKEVRTVNV